MRPSVRVMVEEEGHPDPRGAPGAAGAAATSHPRVPIGKQVAWRILDDRPLDWTPSPRLVNHFHTAGRASGGIALAAGRGMGTIMLVRTIHCIVAVTVIAAATGVTLSSPARASCVATALRKQALLADCMAGCARRARCRGEGRAFDRAPCEERCQSNYTAAVRGMPCDPNVRCVPLPIIPVGLDAQGRDPVPP